VAYRHVVEVSPLLTYMRAASDVSSHSSGAFPSGGFNLHPWPYLWSGLFLAREKRENRRRRPAAGWAISPPRIVKYRVATSPGEMRTMMRAVSRRFNVASPAGEKLIYGRFLDLPFLPVIRGAMAIRFQLSPIFQSDVEELTMLQACRKP